MKTDFILSLGPECRPAWYLKINKLRYVSSPFDWMMGYRLETFIYFLKQKNLNGFFENKLYLDRDSGRYRVVRDTKYGVTSMHAFPKSMSLDEYYPIFIEIMNSDIGKSLRQ